MGEARKEALRVDFDSQIKLEFHGAAITSVAGQAKPARGGPAIEGQTVKAPSSQLSQVACLQWFTMAPMAFEPAISCTPFVFS